MTKLSKRAVGFLCMITLGVVCVPVTHANRFLYLDQYGKWQVAGKRYAQLVKDKETFLEVKPQVLGLTERVYLTDGNFAYATELVGKIDCAGSNGMLRIEIQDASRLLVWKNKSEVINEVTPASQGLPKTVYFSDGYPSNILAQISSYGQAILAAQNLLSFVFRQSSSFEAFGEIDFIASNGRMRLQYCNPQGGSRSIWKHVSEVSPEVMLDPRQRTAEFNQKSMRGNMEIVSGKVLKEGRNGRILIQYYDEYRNRMVAWRDKTQVHYEVQLDDLLEDHRARQAGANSSSIPPASRASGSLSEAPIDETQSALNPPEEEPSLTLIALPSISSSHSSSSKTSTDPQTSFQWVHPKRPKMLRIRREKFTASPASVLSFTQDIVRQFDFTDKQDFVESLSFSLLDNLLNRILDFAQEGVSSLQEPSKRVSQQVTSSVEVLINQLQAYQPLVQEEIILRKEILKLLEDLVSRHQIERNAIETPATSEEVD